MRSWESSKQHLGLFKRQIPASINELLNQNLSFLGNSSQRSSF